MVQIELVAAAEGGGVSGGQGGKRGEWRGGTHAPATVWISENVWSGGKTWRLPKFSSLFPSSTRLLKESSGCEVGFLNSSKGFTTASKEEPAVMLLPLGISTTQESGSVAAAATVIRHGEPRKCCTLYVPCVTSRVQSPAYGMTTDAVREAWVGESLLYLRKRG